MEPEIKEKDLLYLVKPIVEKQLQLNKRESMPRQTSALAPAQPSDQQLIDQKIKQQIESALNDGF